MTRTPLVLLALSASLIAAPLTAQTSSEERGTPTRAAEDYLAAFYDGDEGRLRRSVHEEVVKVGYVWEEQRQEYRVAPLTFDQMLNLAAAVRAGRNLPPEGAPREVEVLHEMDQVAVVKVTGYWGIDYVQMAVIDGRWQIKHVIWQSEPR